MKKIEMCRKVMDFGKEGQRTLVYYLIKSERKGKIRTVYGIGVRMQETGEEAVYIDVSSDYKTVCRLLDLAASGYVTPITLGDVIYDNIE